MECLDLIIKFKEEEKSGEKPSIPAMMGALNVKTPEDFLAKTLFKIRSRFV